MVMSPSIRNATGRDPRATAGPGAFLYPPRPPHRRQDLQLPRTLLWISK